MPGNTEYWQVKQMDLSMITACGESCAGCEKKKLGICRGCIEADGYVPEWAASGRCPVHACCRDHGVQFCGLCAEFPCAKLPGMVHWNPDIVDRQRKLAETARRGIWIRKALPEDARITAELAVLLWPEHSTDELAEEMGPLLSGSESAVFLAFAGDKPVAFAQCQLRHDYVEGTGSSPVGYLEGIYVAGAYRKQGVARNLLAGCEQWAKEKGCREFASDCELTNLESQAFHQAVGFREANRIVAYVRDL